MSERRPHTFGTTAQLIAVCPLLAMSDTVVDALGIGVILVIVVPLAAALLAVLRRHLTNETALAASMLTLAALVACIELLLSAWFSELRTSLALFVPLIVSNLVVVQHLQARHESFRRACAGSLRIAIGIAVTLLPLSIARELVGRGSLLHDAGNLLGAWASSAELSVFRVDMGFLLAMLPPGAFISFGLLLAARNWVAHPIRSLMNKKKVAAIFARLKSLNPKPTTELEYSTPFELLVAVILSAQATDKSVNLATRTLFKHANTPQAIAKLGIEGLSNYIRTIGLYNTKAKNVIEMCRILLEQHGGAVPESREALEALPGVGRKTANVILNTAFGQPTIAVDTHIFRVANRTGLAPGENVRDVEDHLLKVVPPEYAHDAHHWLILHGRYTCVARKPKCPECPILELCEFREKTRSEKPRAERTRKTR